MSSDNYNTEIVPIMNMSFDIIPSVALFALDNKNVLYSNYYVIIVNSLGVKGGWGQVYDT